jgi:type III restriction enzyme
MTGTIDRLIINSPYEEPQQYWSYLPESRNFVLQEGRRPAGYLVASKRSRSYDDPGEFRQIPLVNDIRKRIKAWREAGYPGTTGITRQLLEYWNDSSERDNRFFFCQLEAIETLIWLVEAPESDKVGIEVPCDDDSFQRICSKMATGSGKTIVMAMLIAWQILNKVTYPQDPRYSKYVFVVAPGLTVKSRLQVLMPDAPNNYYDAFSIIPPGLHEKLRQGKVLIENWHTLAWEDAEKVAKKRTVDKRGPKSNEAYVRGVLGELARANNLLVINDEAHHAWRVPAESKIKGVSKDELTEATVWVQGLDRIHAARNILCCYDFTATPFAPTGKKTTEEALFEWIVSDFGLNDAIESGLVKTPRIVIRDDSINPEFRSRLYHIYNDPDVKDNLNRKAEEHEPLPQLVTNAYYLLGKDWEATYELWQEMEFPTPPVMITIANRTETAARVKYSFQHNKIDIEPLCIPETLLHIDSKVLEKAESQTEPVIIIKKDDEEDEEDESDRKLTQKETAELLRQMVDTVGQPGKPGASIRNVISVGMLSEGWDAKTVTHIMGLRAFSSQLLCEQVVGRGLRRTSYEVNPETSLFDPEYVNIFGVPFTFLPHESKEGPLPPPPKPRVQVEPDPAKSQHEIQWPNVIRIEHTYRPVLELDIVKAEPLSIDASAIVKIAELSPVIEGKPDASRISTIDLEKLAADNRYQRIIFKTASDVFDQMKPSWEASKEYLLAQLIPLIERFLHSDKIVITPKFYAEDDLRRRIVLTLSMQTIVQHIWQEIRKENKKFISPVFDRERPIRSTGDMRTWYTAKPCERTQKSHINVCVFDSTWEATEAFELDRNTNVESWVKNDHLGFDILYIFEGTVRKYRPDFLIRLKNGTMLVLETKGQETQRDKTKRKFLNEWIEAINSYGGFGHWTLDISTNPGDIRGIIEAAMKK